MIKVKRSIFVGVRFQPEEYEFLCEKAEKDPETRMRTGSKNLSAYVRKKTLQESGYQKELQIQKELKRTGVSVPKNRNEYQSGNEAITYRI